MPKQGATLKVGTNTTSTNQKDFNSSGIEGLKGANKLGGKQ